MTTGCWWRHRWPKWSAPEQVTVKCQRTVAGVDLGEPRDLEFFQQERTCERCGLYERRMLDIDGRAQ